MGIDVSDGSDVALDSELAEGPRVCDCIAEPVAAPVLVDVPDAVDEREVIEDTVLAGVEELIAVLDTAAVAEDDAVAV